MNKFFKIILAIITGYLLTALAITYSSQAITALQWQAKALGIQSVLGTETQDWWLMSPLRIAWDVVVADPQNIISALIAAGTWIVQMFVRGR